MVEAFSRGHGRLGLLARGARRPGSALRGQLMAFQPLRLSWSGKGEPKLLTRVEWQPGQAQLSGLPLLCGFYLNELLLRLLQREDPHEGLFEHYAGALAQLPHARDVAAVLRLFEMRLLEELGYALMLETEAGGAEPVLAERCYAYHAERGPQRALPQGHAVQFRGKTLLDMARGDFSDPQSAQEAKLLLRTALRRHLGEQELKTRQLLKDLHEL